MDAEGRLQWARAAMAVSTFDELIAVEERFKHPGFLGNLKLQRRNAEEARIDLAKFEKEKLKGVQAWIQKFFIDCDPSVDPPADVREPRERNPSGLSSAASVPEPDDDRKSLNAVSEPQRR